MRCWRRMALLAASVAELAAALALVVAFVALLAASVAELLAAAFASLAALAAALFSVVLLVLTSFSKAVVEAVRSLLWPFARCRVLPLVPPLVREKQWKAPAAPGAEKWPPPG